MTFEEGFEFATDLIRLHRPEGYAGPVFAPFSEKGLALAITKLGEPAGGHLTPRRLMQVLDNALSNVLVEQRTVVDDSDIQRAVEAVETAVEEQE
jgi:hypothetical protein